MEDRIEKIVDLAAPVSRVWRAVTDHEEFGQWFRVALDGPFEEGGISRGKITYPGYEGLKWEVLVHRMDHERLFSFSWVPGADDRDADFSSEPKVLVEFRLEPTSTGTRLTITESGFRAIPDPRRIDVMRENTEGWNLQARNIAAHVES